MVRGLLLGWFWVSLLEKVIEVICWIDEYLGVDGVVMGMRVSVFLFIEMSFMRLMKVVYCGRGVCIFGFL